MRYWILGAVFSLLGSPSHAEYMSWSVASITSDPFTKGTQIYAEFATSQRSAVGIFCDTAQEGLGLRVVPGFPISDELRELTPEVAAAVDGHVLFAQRGVMYVVGDNLAMVQAPLDIVQSWRLLTAMSGARSQIAFKDGFSASNHLLSTEGAGYVGATVMGCLLRQAGD